MPFALDTLQSTHLSRRGGRAPARGLCVSRTALSSAPGGGCQRRGRFQCKCVRCLCGSPTLSVTAAHARRAGAPWKTGTGCDSRTSLTPRHLCLEVCSSGHCFGDLREFLANRSFRVPESSTVPFTQQVRAAVLLGARSCQLSHVAHLQPLGECAQSPCCKRFVWMGAQRTFWKPRT